MQNQKDSRKVNFAFDVKPDGKIVPMREVKTNIRHEIPAGIYRLEITDELGMHLEPVNDFKLPERIYGKVHNYAQRFMRAYELSNKNLGALLIGDPGSGKTLTLKQLAVLAVEMGYPMVLIDKPFAGPLLSGFLNTITQPCVVGVDEFDKKYGEKVPNPREPQQGQPTDEQDSILEILDGTASGEKKLFCFTANDDNRISQYMKDRPSRIRYTIPFKRIEREAAVDYVTTNLKKCTEEDIRAFLMLALADSYQSNGMNFDSMVELVKEMNDFECSLDEALELMIRNGKKVWTSFEITVFRRNEAGENEKVQKLGGFGIHKSAYVSATSDYTISAMMTLPAEEGEEVARRVSIELTKDHFVGFGEDLDMYEFQLGNYTFMAKLVDASTAQKASSEAEGEYMDRDDVKEYKAKSMKEPQADTPEHPFQRGYVHPHLRHLPKAYNMDEFAKAQARLDRPGQSQKIQNSSLSGAHASPTQVRNGTNG